MDFAVHYQPPSFDTPAGGAAGWSVGPAVGPVAGAHIGNIAQGQHHRMALAGISGLVEWLCMMHAPAALTIDQSLT